MHSLNIACLYDNAGPVSEGVSGEYGPSTYAAAKAFCEAQGQVLLNTYNLEDQQDFISNYGSR